MAVCASCGNQVEESASFCTSCGKPMAAAAHPSAAITVARPVCSSCGAQADPGSVFCTGCGKRLDAEPVPVDEAIPAVAAAIPLEAETTAPTASLNPFCTSCGTKIEAGSSFCTNCGQPAAVGSTNVPAPETKVVPAVSEVETTQPVRVEPVTAAPVSAEQTNDLNKAEPVDAVPALPKVKSTPAAAAATSLVEDRPAVVVPVVPAAVEPTRVEQTHVEPAPQIAAPVYATPSDYPPTQPGGSALRMIVFVLLLLIVVGGFGGWYFMGVETVIVCSPPDVTVFLDNKELPPTSYGRYVIPHLSRQPHLLRVQRTGFADTIERLDFPMTSLHEWVNVKLVPRRQTRPSSAR
jgi:double zinc ribbon protein/zinc ribbon protein